MNTNVGVQSETLVQPARAKFDKIVQQYFNQCAPLRPLLGAITLTKVESAPKERKQRQPKHKEQVDSNNFAQLKLFADNLIAGSIPNCEAQEAY